MEIMKLEITFGRTVHKLLNFTQKMLLSFDISISIIDLVSTQNIPKS